MIELSAMYICLYHRFWGMGYEYCNTKDGYVAGLRCAACAVRIAKVHRFYF